MRAFLLGVFYSIQDNLLFYPDVGPHRTCVSSPEIYTLPFEVVYIKTRDKVSLHAYFIRHPEQKGSIVPTFVYFHGNAGNIGGRLQNCYGIYHNLQCNILLVGEFSSAFLISAMTQRTKFNLFFCRIPRLRIVRGRAEWKRPLHWRTCCHRLFVYKTRPRPLTNCAVRTKLGWSCGKKSAVMEIKFLANLFDRW